jgi:hypothetical protein
VCREVALKPAAVYTGHTGAAVTCVAAVDNSTSIASGASDGSLHVWKVLCVSIDLARVRAHGASCDAAGVVQVDLNVIMQASTRTAYPVTSRSIPGSRPSLKEGITPVLRLKVEDEVRVCLSVATSRTAFTIALAASITIVHGRAHHRYNRRRRRCHRHLHLHHHCWCSCLLCLLC